MAVVDYQIVVPSRARPEAFERMNALLPMCVFCVDEREAAAYSNVPAHRLLLHRPTKTISEVRQCILDLVKAPCVVMVDDDLVGIKPMVGDRRVPITDPGSIGLVIENSVNVTADLGLSLFAWNRNPVPLQFQPHDPMHLVNPCAAAFGIIGRKLKFDQRLMHGEDADITLKALLRDRVVFCDNRYFWLFGTVGAGSGGCQGVRTSENVESSKAILRRTWGHYLELDKDPGSQKHNTSKGTRNQSMSIRVTRH